MERSKLIDWSKVYVKYDEINVPCVKEQGGNPTHPSDVKFINGAMIVDGIDVFRENLINN